MPDTDDQIKKISDSWVRFVDIVFSVVVGVSIANFFQHEDISTIWPLPGGSLVAAWVGVLLSWIGYHRLAVKQHYLLNRWAYFRFGIDVIIVFMYAFIIFNWKEFSNIPLVFAIVFALYAIGGLCRNREYKQKVSWPIGALTYAGIFVMIYFSDRILENFLSREIINLDPSFGTLKTMIRIILLVGVIAAFFIYRYQIETRHRSSKMVA